MKSISEIIAESRKSVGLNQSELARRLNITPQSVQAWESGRATPRPAMLSPLAHALSIEPATLIGAVLNTAPGDMREKTLHLIRQAYDDRKAELDADLGGQISVWDEETPLNDDEVYVPYLKEVELSAGSGRFAIEESGISQLRFFKRDLRHNGVQFNNARCVTVTGNSMFPVLRDGATVGVNVGKTSLSDVVDGEMYAINHNGQLRIKQMFRTPIGIKLRSFNRDEHPDEEYTFQQIQDQQISIVGHVFWWGMFSK
ncbi:XRE family transcriptional regulator [Pseudomonas fitomaticsae]|uniref:Helix-turn-helix domain-containing protein n=1 Tax=Pseudomonas fitomaticsae TaxID=2837969 RepID=A0ABY3PYD4_9PSED|nr:XRE family transcriptional regulator [Pseudomonas fitomaticsae]UFP98578.1 helix-turn-helix domain-containing protein [Pseudomonas fitomaticsae]